MSVPFAITMWVLFALVAFSNCALVIATFVAMGKPLYELGSAPLFAAGQLCLLLLLVALLVRDVLRQKRFAKAILVVGLLGLSWAQLKGAGYGLIQFSQTPKLLWLSLATITADAALGSVALLSFSSSVKGAALTRKDFMVGLLFVLSLGITAQLLFGAVRTGVGYVATASQAPRLYSAEIERRFLAGDAAVLQNVEVLLEIVRFGSTPDVRSKASMELLSNHKSDPRALLGLQLHAVEEFRRVEEAIGKR